MIERLKALLGLGPSTDYSLLMKEGAIILDVRSNAEYVRGHIKGSLNISVDQLANSIQRLPRKDTPVIICCASGMRSAAATRLLTAKGFKSVYDAGSWASLERGLRG